MDLRYTAEELAFRDEVRAFLKENLSEDIRRKLVDGEHMDKDDLVTWSRILNDAEALIAINTNGSAGRGSRIELDPGLRPAGSQLRVVCDTSRIGSPGADALGGGRMLQVQPLADGRVFVDVGVLGPAEVMVLA